MGTNSMILVKIRLHPSNQELDVDIPLTATAKDVIDQLLSAGLDIPAIDQQGNPINYMLVPKGSNEQIEDNQTVGDAHVQSGDVLLLMPNAVAG